MTEDNSGEAAERRSERARSGRLRFPARRCGCVSPSEAEPMAPAGIMFTSGTTSRPKAVVHTHANALWASRVGPNNIDMRGDDTYLIYLPFFHVNAQSWSTWSTLGAGGTVVLQPKFSVEPLLGSRNEARRDAHLADPLRLQGGRGTAGPGPQAQGRHLRPDHARSREMAEDPHDGGLGHDRDRDPRDPQRLLPDLSRRLDGQADAGLRVLDRRCRHRRDLRPRGNRGVMGPGVGAASSSSSSTTTTRRRCRRPSPRTAGSRPAIS